MHDEPGTILSVVYSEKLYGYRKHTIALSQLTVHLDVAKALFLKELNDELGSRRRPMRSTASLAVTVTP